MRDDEDSKLTFYYTGAMSLRHGGKLTQPKDYPCGRDEQVRSFRVGIAYLLVFGFLVWLGGWCINGLCIAYLEAMK